MLILGWPLKRVAIARLQSYADGTVAPPAGAELLVSSVDRPVQVEHKAPPEPDRICVYGAPLRAQFGEVTAERPDVLSERAVIEIRVRCYDPGDDVPGLDQVLGDMCQAVAVAMLTPPLSTQVRVWLSAIVQAPDGLTQQPEPAVVSSASLLFTAEAVAYG